MADRDQASQAILDAIIAGLSSGGALHIVAPAIKDLAEAYAWLRSPGQSHGGGTSSGK